MSLFLPDVCYLLSKYLSHLGAVNPKNKKKKGNKQTNKNSAETKRLCSFYTWKLPKMKLLGHVTTIPINISTWNTQDISNYDKPFLGWFVTVIKCSFNCTLNTQSLLFSCLNCILKLQSLKRDYNFKVSPWATETLSCRLVSLIQIELGGLLCLLSLNALQLLFVT